MKKRKRRGPKGRSSLGESIRPHCQGIVERGEGHRETKGQRGGQNGAIMTGHTNIQNNIFELEGPSEQDKKELLVPQKKRPLKVGNLQSNGKLNIQPSKQPRGSTELDYH